MIIITSTGPAAEWTGNAKTYIAVSSWSPGDLIYIDEIEITSTIA